ncbi:helix-turn-helix domain-containing protein [uncultured Draconibacterium sp.]|uniref:helix-turn-helix domain-containing protein n=1 Tax=uncultured Draconibacterium sp. TaxID=1573823 RepID=UPI0029C81CA4|nr:helix-turn-helix domain-containing protein [uncultured Draconibacterium sp.]
MSKNFTICLEVPENKIKEFIEEAVSKQLLKNSKDIAPPAIFSVKQLAKYIGMAEVSVYKKVRETSIPFFKVGRKVLFRKNEIDSWLEGHRVFTTKEFIDDVESESSR